MVRWEYKIQPLFGVVHAKDKLVIQDLAELGDEGWEAVGVWTQTTTGALGGFEVMILCKRKKYEPD